ncbi:tetratricopeptide repeat protein [Psychrobacillus sp. FSL K6-4615]|uniref:tetratricopeptide repeat protein n=1 Tax=Psychrobacillus sp. FSL K6-4615 TaxID=2921551 RepID=UPI0030FC94F9
MKIADKTVRNVVVVLIVVLILGIFYASKSSEKQDEQFFKEQATFNQAIDYFQGGQYELAIPLLTKVGKEQPESEVVKYYLALALSNTGEWSSASQEYQEVLNVNPYKVKDSMFMIQFAEVLLNAEKFEEAKVVLERCQTLPIPDQMPDYQEFVNILLMQVSMKS